MQRDGNQSVIVEIVEAAGDDDVAGSGFAGDPAQFHFADIATANGAASSVVLSSRAVGAGEAPAVLGHATAARAGPTDPRAAGASAWLLHGTQRVAKFRGDAAGPAGHDVHILLCVLRLPAVATDILVTWNVPPAPGGEGAAGAGGGGDGMEGAQAGMAALLASFTIEDYGLFTP